MKRREITVSAAAISHIGCVRGNNEDNLFFDGDYMRKNEVNGGVRINAVLRRPNHLFAICDGMGGLNGGEDAAAIGVESLSYLEKKLRSGTDMHAYLHNFTANVSQRIFADGESKKSGKQGATLALLMLRGEVACVANVGDSRVYLLRMGSLMQLSRDHTMVYTQMLQEKLTREQARKHPSGNRIYQYLGMPLSQIHDDFMYYRECALCNGDRFLICSDGISDLISHEHLTSLLAAHSTPIDAAAALVSTALELGGKDNATCIVGDICSPALPFATPADLAALDITSSSSNTQETTAK